MKTIHFTLVLFCLTSEAVLAQGTGDKFITITRVKKGEEPQEVMTAVKNDFPDVIVKDISFLPKALQDREWAVQEVDNSGSSDVRFYNVQASSDNMKFDATYDRTGKLLSYKETLNQAALPESVMKTLNEQFSDWRVLGNQERFTLNPKTTKVVYRVELAKDKAGKHVFLDDNGKVLRQVRKLRI
ncbi:hypothetical protein [Spirosoma pulveris]